MDFGIGQKHKDLTSQVLIMESVLQTLHCKMGSMIAQLDLKGNFME